ncbi:MAG TPA: zf-TFIIB domain-containing protein [Pararhizobium sp.]|nr:zf-TFIIB domain-containing protein [Pararhizobium sp.]
MKCPIDDTELTMSERQGIEIDYCPKCRGVWLDRGELDKIIERSAAAEDPRPRRQDEPRYRDEHYASHRPYKKRKSLLGEIFDF